MHIPDSLRNKLSTATFRSGLYERALLAVIQSGATVEEAVADKVARRFVALAETYSAEQHAEPLAEYRKLEEAVLGTLANPHGTPGNVAAS